MHLCTYTYIYMYVLVHVYTYVHIPVSITNTYIYVRIHISTNIYMPTACVGVCQKCFYRLVIGMVDFGLTMQLTAAQSRKKGETTSNRELKEVTFLTHLQSLVMFLLRGFYYMRAS